MVLAAKAISRHDPVPFHPVCAAGPGLVRSRTGSVIFLIRLQHTEPRDTYLLTPKANEIVSPTVLISTLIPRISWESSDNRVLT